MHNYFSSRQMVVRPMPHPPNLRDPDHCAVSSTYWAVTLLLAALEVGQNVDRLARCTGCKRSFVARCVRRLVDNGVWRNGRTICTWAEERERHPSFWKDVAVAEGKLCRREDARGELEWAPPGAWARIPVAAYAEEELPTAPRETVPLPPPAPRKRRRRGGSAAVNGAANGGVLGASAPDASDALATDTSPAAHIPVPRDRLSILFPDAVWLG